MPAVSLHGVRIAWSLTGLSHDPLAEVVAGLAPVTAETPEPTATLHVELHPAPATAAANPRGDGWKATIFHGVVEALHSSRGFVVWDRASRVFVAPGGSPIDAQIAPPECEIDRGSTKTALQVALALALRQVGLFHFHAAALVLPSGVPVFVVGGSGAGKTSTTLALLEGSGADYLGDDTLYLAGSGSAPDGELHVIAFPREFHVGEAALAAIPRLAPLVGPMPAHGTKRPLDARRAYPGRFRPSLSLGRDARTALALFPSVVASPVTEIVPLARAAAFGNLLASSGAIVCEGVPGRDANVALLSALLGAVRCYEVRLGADALADPASAIGAKVAQLARLA